MMKKAVPFIVLVVLAVAALLIKQCNTPTVSPTVKPVVSTKKKTTSNNTNTAVVRGLNRNPAHINYSKHARCRMACRHIDENEVEQILQEGKINYTKSELDGADCKKKYAVEGLTRDKQRVRIIFAPCSDEVTVVTVIDIGKEWPCDCE